MKMQKTWQFAWIAQAALIVLPVVVLSGVALHFLREDKTAIEKEARARANSLAPEAARQIGDQITAWLANNRKNGLVTQGEIIDGHGYAEPDYQPLPVPAGWMGKLPPREAQLW